MSSIISTSGRGFSTNCFVWFFIFHHFTAVARYSVAEANETRELDLKQLGAQIDALIIQRQDDFNKLEALARNSLNKDAEIDQLRNEIRDLKLELDSVKAKHSSADCAADGGVGTGGGGSGCGNRVKNEQLTVEWLSNSISEIRAEIAEMAKSFNSTAALQQHQAFSTDVSILQNDVVSLRHDAEHLKADAAKYDAKLSAFGMDMDALKQTTSGVATKVANMTQQIRAFSAAYTYNWPTPLKPSKKNKHLAVFKKMMVLNENPLQMQVYTTTRRRRRRRVNCRNSHVNEPAAAVVRPDNGHHSDSESGNGHGNDRYDQHRDAELEKRVQMLEKFFNETTPSRDREQAKLRSSMLELLELVGNLEAKFDNITPVLRKEISKMEFSLAQIVANLSVARERQENDKLLVTTIAENLSETRSKLALYERQFSASQEKFNDKISASGSFLDYGSFLLNDILQQQHLQNWTQLIPRDISTSQLSDIISSLLNQYAAYFRRLPKNCDEVDGESGLYLLSVYDHAMPILVYCERNFEADSTATVEDSASAYVVIQRRIFGGKTDFNRNWQDYARGFGDLQGEFWLGNEIIHSMTRNNDTTLRIELEDISGLRWYAEYDTFGVASRQRDFQLHIGGFSGNVSDAFRYHNGMPFSTKDADHDSASENCAADYETGWWFSRCQRANLNAKYNLGFSWYDSAQNEWIDLRSTKMMLKKRTHS